MAGTYLSEQELIAFIASLPTRRLAAAALIRNQHGELLAVKPNYKDGWTLPGGTVEAGEDPKTGCFREVEEEVGLQLEHGRVVLIFHGLNMGLWADSTSYLYDGGVIPADTPIVLQEEELLEHRWVAENDFTEYFGASFGTRLQSAFTALRDGSVVEVSSGSVA